MSRIAEQFLGQRRRLLHQRRVETLQHVRVRLEGQHEELLDFPVGFLRLMAFQLFRNAVQRPVQVGGRQVEPTAVDVGFVVGQTVCLRADDALEDHPVEQLTSLRCEAGVADDSLP